MTDQNPQSVSADDCDNDSVDLSPEEIAELEQFGEQARSTLQDLNASEMAEFLSEEPLTRLLERFDELPEACLADTVSRLAEQTCTGNAPDLPARIANYELLGEIGSGGMGVVFLGRHDLMRQERAVKLISPERVGSSSGTEAFKKEIFATGKVSEICRDVFVTAHEAGVENGWHYLITDFIEGSDLGRLVRKNGPMPVAVACEIARVAAVAIAEAHRQGLIHRDLKPSNLMLMPDGRVRILDFGLMVITGRKESSEQPNAISGTLPYMAPEQLTGEAPLSPSIDIYSLGATLFHLLARVPPHILSRQSSRSEQIQARLESGPRDITEFRKDLPMALVKRLRQTLSPSPSDRPASMEEFAKSMARFASPEALKGWAAHCFEQKPWQPPARSRFFPAIAVAAVVAIIAAGFWIKSTEPVGDIAGELMNPAPPTAGSDSDTRVRNGFEPPDWSAEEVAAAGPVTMDEPALLEEWLAGKQIVTVSQDGTGDFRSIYEATRPDVLKPGQVVEVLDKGPYIENLNVSRLPAGCGLISRVGTILIVDVWKDRPNGGDEVRQKAAHLVTRSPDFRLSGFRFHYNRQRFGMPLQLFAFGDAIIENCVFIGTGKQERGLRLDEVRLFLRFQEGFTTESRDEVPRLWVRNNVFCSPLRLQSQVAGHVEFLVRRNLFVGNNFQSRLEAWPGPREGKGTRFVVEKNVFDCRLNGSGIGFVDETSTENDLSPNGVLEVDRNTFFSIRHDGIIQRRSETPLQRLSFTRNLVDGSRQAWLNAVLPAPAFVRFNCIPASRDQSRDNVRNLIVKNSLNRADVSSADYMRISRESGIAEAFADSEIHVPGAVRANAASRSEDWLDKLRNEYGRQLARQTQIASDQNWPEVVP